MSASGNNEVGQRISESTSERSARKLVALGAIAFACLACAGWADVRFDWFRPSFQLAARLFYEKSPLAEIREPTQIPLARVHFFVLGAMIAAGFIASAWLRQHARRWWCVFCVAYAIRATCWIVGGNLPLVPGDSCHYLEVAASIARGEGPVKHYVESFFIDYPAIRRNQGVLDDWATPLWAYVLAGVFRTLGVTPLKDLTATVAVAKGTSFALNLLCLPALYVFARRRYDRRIAFCAMGLIAILPVHAIYAGFGLRESLVALTSILAVWWFTEACASRGPTQVMWAFASGAAAGFAILARNTAFALAAACAIHALLTHGRRSLGMLAIWGVSLVAVITPWAWATYQAYGEPFYTYTKFFPYNFSWTVHHYEHGNTRPDQFYTRANLPGIVRIKLRAILIITFYSVMIISAPVAMGFLRQLRSPSESKSGVARLAATIACLFTFGTLMQVADVTQVEQLGRYFLPVYIVALVPAAAAIVGWIERSDRSQTRLGVVVVLAALLWSNPSWAYDATWFTKTYQLHWPALRAAGEWVRTHPEQVPPTARVMTWFPWEFRAASDRTTILFPRSSFLPHITRVIDQYRVTHILWGSFEPPPDIDPEAWSAHLEQIRSALGLRESNEIYRGPVRLPYPVRLYRIDGRSP